MAPLPTTTPSRRPKRRAPKAHYEPKIEEIRQWIRTARKEAKPYEPRWVAAARNPARPRNPPTARFWLSGSRIVLCEGPGWLLIRQDLGAPSAGPTGPGPQGPGGLDNPAGAAPSSSAGSEAADMAELPDLNSMSIS